MNYHSTTVIPSLTPKWKKLISWLTVAVYLTQPSLAAAQVIADGSAPANQRPAIENAQNGVQVVQITAPSAAGVSRNQYLQFNVDTQGLILNNASSFSQTQLAGYIAGNTNLAGGSARIILNEVTGPGRSYLNGYTEIAGQRADLIIANPNGITGNGFGFINAGRATLTTGIPVFGGSGSLEAFRVTQGQIAIEGVGLNASATDRVDLISRAVAVNAGIWAKELNVVTGANQADYNTLATNSITGTDLQPAVALDVGALGGMYANKIKLVGTERGLGVNSQGTLAASNGDLILSQEGKISLAGNTSAAGNIHITAGDDFTNQDTLYAQGNTSIVTQGAITNSGILAAAEHTALNGQAITSTGTLGAGVQANGVLGSGGDLTLTANGTVTAQGKNLTAGTLTIKGSEINLVAGQTYAGADINLQTTAGNVDNTGALLQAEGKVAILANGTLKNDKDSNNIAGEITGSQITITANDISNKDGIIQQTGTNDTTLTTSGIFNNTGGTIASKGATTLDVAKLINRQGTIQAFGSTDADLRITASGDIDNSELNGEAGVLGASGNTFITANSLNNNQGNITAGKELVVSSNQGINNTQGLMAANQRVNITGNQIDNQNGTIGSIYGQAGITAAGLLNNTSGRIEAAQSVDISSKGMNNSDGVIIGSRISADSNAEMMDNTRGQLIASGGSVHINSGSLNNDAGLIQASEDLSVNTHGQTLYNTNSGSQGGIVAQGEINLETGNLVNRAGYLYSGDTLSAVSSTIDNNQGGLMTSSAGIDITAATLNNQGAQIQALGDIGLNLTNTLNNQDSLIRSSQNLTIGANAIKNNSTQSNNQGLEGQSVSLTASLIDNRQGAVRADNVLTLTSNGQVQNNQGLISSGKNLIMEDNQASKTLLVTNTSGTMIAGQKLGITSAALSGDGKVLSQGDLDVRLVQDYTNSGELQASGNLNLEIGGKVTNQAAILAGNSLNINAGSIDNAASAEISAQNTVLTTGVLTNRGLIDGGETLVDAATVNNRGTGRIYGNHIAIQSNTLNNDVEGGTAAVIAARDRLDIGAKNITNREHSLIFSAGDMFIGGSLDSGKKAIGQNISLNNNSATIEALGNLNLTSKQIYNTNEHFSTTVQTIKTESIVEYQGSGSPYRYVPGTPNVYIYNDESDHLHTPEGNYENWLAYNYTRTTTETKVQTSDPAQILSGGAMQINAETVTNDKSQIIAGGTLGGIIGTLNNTEVPGVHIVTDTGSVTSYWRDHHHGRDSTGSSTSGYNPAASKQDITLTPTVYEEKTTPNGTGTQVAGLTEKQVSQTVTDTSVANITSHDSAVVNQIARVTTLTGGTVSSGTVNTSIPNSSLFKLTPNSNVNYLIETDPRFADYRTWISSDYMIQALNIDPNGVQKRLGDGFYEQKLVRDQITQLTGQRYLDGYTSDEDQYVKLMSNAAVFAQEHQLSLGVALSTEQMAQLTSDIVWLVDKEILLPNGQVTHALVPQVYVRGVKDGDLTTSGALIAGNDIKLELSGDLNNNGTIAGRNGVDITAENIRNLGGRIGGTDVALQARTDLDNIGGQIQASNSLVVTAGRDINVVSTTDTQSNAQGSRTVIDRTAGLYVNGDKGVMVVSAGRDINLVAAQIGNSGQDGSTSIIAGNNLNMGTVTIGDSNHLVWDSNNYRNDSSSMDVGTTIQSQGNIRLQAGNDLNAKAASVESIQGELVATAGRDVNLTEGQANLTVDEAHKHKGHSGGLSSITITTRDTVNETSAVGTIFSGDTTSILAGQNITVKGSNVVATNDVNLAAQGNVTITAATETNQEDHFRQEKKSGLFSGGGLGFTIGTQKQTSTDSLESVSQKGSVIGSTDGSVNIEAGKDVLVKASDIVSKKDTDITGQNVTIEAAANTVSERQTYEFKQTGLSVSIGSQGIDNIQGVAQPLKRADEVEDGRLKALYDYKAVKAVDNLSKGKNADGSKPNKNNGLTVSISLGTTKEQRETNYQVTNATPSQVTAGGDLTIKAVGSGAKDEQGKASDGNLNIIGSKIDGQNIYLGASKDVNLIAEQNTTSTDTTTSGKSAGIGVKVSEGSAPGFFVNGSMSSSNEDGTTLTHTNTYITAVDTVRIESGDDTNLKGAQVKGKTIDIDAGGDLNLESLQDVDNYKESSKSSGVTIGFGAGGLSGTASASKGKINSEYQSVTEQTGIYAGEGGFDIKVGGNTDLQGAVIASEATPDKNKLSTGTLTYSDIENKAAYEASSIGVNLDTRKTAQKKDAGLTPNIGVKVSGDADSTTQSAISPGTIEVRSNPDQDLSNLSRDPSGALNALGKIFDKKTVQEKQELAQVFGEEAFKAIGDLAKTQKENASKRYLNATTDEERAVALADFKSWSEGGTNKILLDTVVGGLASSLGGNGFASGAAGAGTTQLLMNELKNITDPAVLQWTSAIVGAAAATVVGDSAQTGAFTAVSETKNNYLTHTQFELIKDPKELERVAKRQDVLFGASVPGEGSAVDTPAFTDVARTNDSSYSSDVQYALKEREAMLEVINSAYVAGLIDISDRNIVADRLNEEATKIRENANNNGVLNWILNNASILVKDVAAGTIIDNALNPNVLAPGDLSSVILRSLDNPEDSSAIARMILLREKENTINIGSQPASSGDGLAAMTAIVVGFVASKGKNGLGNAKVLDAMKNEAYKKYKIDCSEIAEDLYNASGKNGKIYNITGKEGSLNGYEYGKVENYIYHQVYSDGKYIYDPRFSDVPVLKDDYFKALKEINPDGFNVTELR
ncbi:toxin CdiA [Sporomusaceae bacterium FL31]|nr:toxin CdiA [Sporomusaceae bacterium FL31]GCE33713.1 toxin CdiA [Sporomusaceae bacterium]